MIILRIAYRRIQTVISAMLIFTLIMSIFPSPAYSATMRNKNLEIAALNNTIDALYPEIPLIQPESKPEPEPATVITIPAPKANLDSGTTWFQPQLLVFGTDLGTQGIIKYTMDGSDPINSQTAKTFSEPLLIQTNGIHVIKAVTYVPEYNAYSEIAVYQYTLEFHNLMRAQESSLLDQIKAGLVYLNRIAALENDEISFLLDLGYDILNYDVLTKEQKDLLASLGLDLETGNNDLKVILDAVREQLDTDEEINNLRSAVEDPANPNWSFVLGFFSHVTNAVPLDFKDSLAAKGLTVVELIFASLSLSDLTMDFLNVVPELKTDLDQILSDQGIYDAVSKSTLSQMGINWGNFNQLIMRITADGKEDMFRLVLEKLTGYTLPVKFLLAPGSYQGAQSVQTATDPATDEGTVKWVLREEPLTNPTPEEIWSSGALYSGPIELAQADVDKIYYLYAVRHLDKNHDHDVDFNRELSSVSSAHYTIITYDCQFEFAQASYFVDEGVGSLAVTVKRLKSSDASASVEYYTENGKALAGEDFELLTGRLDFAAGETVKSINLKILNDTKVEFDESMKLVLTNPGNGAALGKNKETTITIDNNDIDFPTDYTYQVGYSSWNTSPGVPESLVTGYFDSDNNIDIAVIISTTNIVRILKGNIFDYWGAKEYATGGMRPKSIISGDFNNDRVIDLAVTNQGLYNNTYRRYDQDNIAVLMGKGDGTFQQAKNYEAGDNPRAIVSGCFDADYYPDLAVVNSGSKSISILRNQGDGTFKIFQTYQLDSPTSLITDDMNQDGRLDLVVGLWNKTIVLMGNGDGTFQTAQNYSAAGSPRNLLIADFNRDGILDLASDTSSYIDRRSVCVNLGNEDGTFQNAHKYSINKIVKNISTGDYDGDTIMDLAAVWNDSRENGISILIGNGDGTFKTAINYSMGWDLEATSISSGDLNDDGSPDLAAVLSGWGSICTYYNGLTFGKVQFATEKFTASEGEGCAAVTVTRSGSTNEQAIVTCAATIGTAQAGIDFIAAGGTITFAPGEASKTFTIDILDDDLVEGEESVRLELTRVVGAAGLGTLRKAELTIRDSENSGEFNFSQGAYFYTENSGTVTAIVDRSGSDGSASVKYTITDGTAVNGQDYQGISGILNFSPGETSKNIEILLLDDQLVEGDETINLVLSEPSTHASLGTLSNAQLTIVDNEIGLEFGQKDFSTIEGNVSITIPVLRKGFGDQEVSVDYLTQNDTALAGEDYTSVASTLTFPEGVTEQTFSVNILDDSLVEGTEKIKLLLTNPAGGAYPGLPSYLSIIDNDNPGMLAFAQSSYRGQEGQSVAVSVYRSSGSDDVVTVEYSTEDGTAKAGKDYVASSGMLTFAAGEINKVFMVELLNDKIMGNEKTLNLRLKNPGGGATISVQDKAALTIADSTKLFKEPKNFQLDSVPTKVAVDDFNKDRRSDLALIDANSQNISVLLSETGGTMKNTVKYPTGINPTGITSGDFNGDGKSDLAVCAPEAHIIAVLLGNGDGSFKSAESYQLPINPYSMTAVDMNNDKRSDLFVVDNAEEGHLWVLYAGSGGRLDSIKKEFRVGSGPSSVNWFSNYTWNQSPAVVVTNNKSNDLSVLWNYTSINYLSDLPKISAGKKPVGIAAADFDGNEMITSKEIVALNSGDNNISYGEYKYTVGEKPSSITAGDFNVDGKPDLVVANSGEDTITILQGLGYPLFELADMPVGEGPVNILRGDFDGNSLDDLVVTGDSSTISFLLNNSLAQVAFNLSEYTVNESEVSAAVTVNLSKAVADTVTVEYATVDGTAAAGTDYQAANGVITFMPGETSKTFSVLINEDTAREETETISLKLFNLIGMVELGGHSTSSIKIIDNDGPGNISFSLPEYWVSERDFTAAIMVVRDEGFGGEVTVDYELWGGTAALGEDYQGQTGTITLGDQETSRTFIVPIVNDDLVEADETVNITLKNPTGGGSLGARSVSVLTIQSDDGPGRFKFSSPNYNVKSRRGQDTNLYFTINRVEGLEGAADVRVKTFDGTAKGGSQFFGAFTDYFSLDLILRFEPGEASKTFSVWVWTFDYYQEARSFKIELINPNTGVKLDEATAAISQSQNNGLLEFYSSIIYASEENASAIVKVQRRGGSEGQATVDYKTMGGTANGGLDYLPVTGTLLFKAGETEKTFTVPIIDDDIVDANDTIGLVLTNIGGASRGSRMEAKIVIDDNDEGKAFTNSPERQHENKEIDFDASDLEVSNGEDLKYWWDFGDGTQGQGIKVSHSYPLQANYWDGINPYSAVLDIRDGGARQVMRLKKMITVVEDYPVDRWNYQITPAAITKLQPGGEVTWTVSLINNGIPVFNKEITVDDQISGAKTIIKTDDQGMASYKAKVSKDYQQWGLKSINFTCGGRKISRSVLVYSDKLKVSGYVMLSGKGIKNARITIENPALSGEGFRPVSVLSDINGYYALEGLRNGAGYKITVGIGDAYNQINQENIELKSDQTLNFYPTKKAGLERPVINVIYTSFHDMVDTYLSNDAWVSGKYISEYYDFPAWVDSQYRQYLINQYGPKLDIIADNSYGEWIFSYDNDWATREDRHWNKRRIIFPGMTDRLLIKPVINWKKFTPKELKYQFIDPDGNVARETVVPGDNGEDVWEFVNGQYQKSSEAKQYHKFMSFSENGIMIGERLQITAVGTDPVTGEEVSAVVRDAGLEIIAPPPAESSSVMSTEDLPAKMPDEVEFEAPDMPFISSTKFGLDLSQLAAEAEFDNGVWKIYLGAEAHKRDSLKDQFNVKKQHQELINKLKNKTYKSGSTDFSLQVGGTLYLAYNTKTEKWGLIRGGIKAAAGGEFSKTWYYLWPKPPILFYVSGTIAAQLEAELGVDWMDKIVIYGEIKPSASIEVAGGIGVKGVLAGEVWGNATLGISLEYTKDHELKRTASFEIGAGARVYYIAGAYETTWDKYSWEDEHTYGTQAAAQVLEAGNAMSALSLAENELTIGDLKPLSRDYLDRQSPWLPNNSREERMGILGAEDAGGNKVEETIMQSGIFPYSEPEIVKTKDGAMLFWITDDGDREGVNLEAVAFSQYDGITWSEPALFDDDGTADFYPEAAALDNGTAVVWVNSGEVLSGSNNPVARLINSEISAAVYHEDTGNWEKTTLTDDWYIDKNPAVAGSGNKAMAVWVKDREDGYSNETLLREVLLSKPDNTDLVYAAWDGSDWSVTETVYSAVGSVVNGSLAFDGNNALYVYVTDEDGDLATSHDWEIYACGFDGSAWSSPMRITFNEVQDAGPMVAYVASIPVICWFSAGKILYKKGLFQDTVSTAVEEIAASGAVNFDLTEGDNGNLALVWEEGINNGQEIFAAIYDPVYDSWSQKIQLTETGGINRSVSAEIDQDGGILAVYNKLSVEDTELSDAKLVFAKLNIGHDLSIAPENVKLSEANPVPGSSVTITANIINQGEKSEENIKVVFFDGDPLNGGEEIGTVIIPGILESGRSAQAATTWDIPAGFQEHQIYVQVDPDHEIADRNTQNNTAYIQAVNADIKVSQMNAGYLGADKYLINVKVTNMGYAAANGITLKLTKGSESGTVIDSKEIGSLMPMEEKETTFTWSSSQKDFTNSLVQVFAQISSIAAEVQTDNNVTYIWVREPEKLQAAAVTQISLNKESLKLAKGDKETLIPLDVGDAQVTWTSANEAVAKVDAAGTVEAVDYGEVLITAKTKEGGFEADCLVKVQEPPVITLEGPDHITLVVGENYVDPGAIAEFEGLDISDKIVFSGNVDATLPGINIITYSCITDDGFAAQEVKRTVVVNPKEVTAAGGIRNLEVSGAEPLALLKLYNEQSVPITAVTTPGPVYTFTQVPLGSGYYVTQTVKGLESSLSNKVSVTMAGKPVITLNGHNDVRVTAGDQYHDLGPTAVDRFGRNATTQIVVSGLPLNTGVPGIYEIKYNLTDSTGSAADEVIRKVIVAPLGVTTAGGINTVSVSGATPQAGLKLYNQNGGTVNTGTAGGSGTYQFTNVTKGTGYYVTQTVNGVESGASNAVAVDDPAGGGPGSERESNKEPLTISQDQMEKSIATREDGTVVEVFTLKNTVTNQIKEAKAQGQTLVEVKVESGEAGALEFNVPVGVLQSARGMDLSISTERASLALPAVLINTLAAAGKDLAVHVEKGDAAQVAGDMTGVLGTEGGRVIGDPVEIKTAIRGNTNVTIPLHGIDLPTNPADRTSFLASLAVFAVHSDGEKEVIQGTILYDAQGNPTGIKFTVDKFSTFAIIKRQADQVKLKDIGSHWAEENIQQLVATGVINGYQDGTFRPNKSITRAEFVTVLVKALKLEGESSKTYSDTEQHWAKHYIDVAASKGIVAGFENNLFKPDELITREQMASMIVKAGSLTGSSSSTHFADAGSISAWAKAAVASAWENKIMGGYPDNSFRPKNHATRAEAVTVVVKLLEITVK